MTYETSRRALARFALRLLGVHPGDLLEQFPRHQLLQAERVALTRMLDQLPVSSVICRLSLEHRKAEVEDQLADLGDDGANE